MAFLGLGKDPIWMPSGHPFLRHIIHHWTHFHRPESCKSRVKGNYTVPAREAPPTVEACFMELGVFILWAVFGLGVICFTYISITFNQPHYVQPGFLLHLLSICIIFDLVCNSLVLVWDVLAFWRRWGPICVPAIVFYAGFGSHLIFYGKRPADFWVRKIGFG